MGALVSPAHNKEQETAKKIKHEYLMNKIIVLCLLRRMLVG